MSIFENQNPPYATGNWGFLENIFLLIDFEIFPRLTSLQRPCKRVGSRTAARGAFLSKYTWKITILLLKHKNNVSELKSKCSISSLRDPKWNESKTNYFNKIKPKSVKKCQLWKNAKKEKNEYKSCIMVRNSIIKTKRNVIWAKGWAPLSNLGLSYSLL